jgi:FkbH-like protein
MAGERLDVKSELLAGFPYNLRHADAMAAMFARLISDHSPKKGLITDLDDTLWKGIVGEVGADTIGWTLDRQAQIHGLYQQLLASLAAAGVLIAAATKNDPEVVDAAFARQDLVLTKDDLFPIEANWEPKSRSVARILHTWNVNADSVVFVDDSAAELAEVAHAHPGIRCCHFPVGDSQAAYRLLEEIRDVFGKRSLLGEDRLRASSLRRNADPAPSPPLPSGGDFLASANPELTAEYCESIVDPRALELINKTNQFNLNGKRHTLASLSRLLQSPGGFIMVVSYRDKYGPLGKIAALCGTCLDDAVHIDTWVMSCRAFSRRIEYWCVAELFKRFPGDCISLDFRATERNSPLQGFLTDVLGGPPFPGCKFARQDFLTKFSRPRQISLETAHA